jgi:hypothetical protein
MSNERVERHYPAVEQLRDALRADLLRAVRVHPHARPRLSRRQRVGVLAAIGVVAVPGGMAVAKVFDSPDVEYECPSAEPNPGAEVAAGVPVDSIVPAVEEPRGTLPVNPCK